MAESRQIKKIFRWLWIISLILIFVPYIFALFTEHKYNSAFVVLFFEMLFIPLFFLFLSLTSAIIWFGALFYKPPAKVDFGLALSPFMPGILLTALISLISMWGLPDTFSYDYFFSALWPHVILVGGVAILFGIWGGLMMVQQLFLRKEMNDDEISLKILKINLRWQLFLVLLGFILLITGLF